MEEFIDRTLGFLPQRSVLWGAILTTILAIGIQAFCRWFEKKAILPWMLEENQSKRKELLNKTQGEQTEN